MKENCETSSFSSRVPWITIYIYSNVPLNLKNSFENWIFPVVSLYYCYCFCCWVASHIQFVVDRRCWGRGWVEFNVFYRILTWHEKRKQNKMLKWYLLKKIHLFRYSNVWRDGGTTLKCKVLDRNSNFFSVYICKRA